MLSAENKASTVYSHCAICFERNFIRGAPFIYDEAANAMDDKSTSSSSDSKPEVKVKLKINTLPRCEEIPI